MLAYPSVLDAIEAALPRKRPCGDALAGNKERIAEEGTIPVVHPTAFPSSAVLAICVGAGGMIPAGPPLHCTWWAVDRASGSLLYVVPSHGYCDTCCCTIVEKRALYVVM